MYRQFGNIPFLFILAVVIRILQGGPVLFTQRRIGLNFTAFTLYKFRTMHIVDADSQAGFTPQAKDRRTQIGKFLRYFKLDELPQLWNVLRGDMSIVGPRPEVPHWVDIDSREWKTVLSVKPGMTDKASLYFFNEDELLRKTNQAENLYRFNILPKKLDIASVYVRKLSFFEDLSIILKTLLHILRWTKGGIKI